MDKVSVSGVVLNKLSSDIQILAGMSYRVMHPNWYGASMNDKRIVKEGISWQKPTMGPRLPTILARQFFLYLIGPNYATATRHVYDYS